MDPNAKNAGLSDLIKAFVQAEPKHEQIKQTEPKRKQKENHVTPLKKKIS